MTGTTAGPTGTGRTAGLFLLLLILMLPPDAFGHGIAGKRFFPTTFEVDNPFISDEFSLLCNSIKMNNEAGGAADRYFDPWNSLFQTHLSPISA